MAESVRVLLAKIQNELLAGDVSPARSCDLLMRSTALIGNCGAEVVAAEASFAVVLLAHVDAVGHVSQARVRAAVTPEAQRVHAARGAKELAVELTRSLKAALRSLEEEMRLS